MLEIAHTYKTNSLSIPVVIPIKQLGINRALFVVPNRAPFAFVAWYYQQSENNPEILDIYSGEYFNSLERALQVLCPDEYKPN